jgi:hypothetical protein
MTKLEAQQVLQAFGPADLDTANPAFAQALALVEENAELKAWWEAQQAFDQRVAAKLADLPLPSDLRESILAGRKIERLAPQPRMSWWLAAAAALAILCAVGTSFHVASEARRHVAMGAFNEAALRFLGDNGPSLAMTSPDHEKIAAWLRSQSAPMGTLPAGAASLPTVGCQKFDVKGHSVSLICFALANGGIAHLFMIHQDDLADPPSRATPDYKQFGDWSTAAWSDGRMSYMLATTAGPNTLRQLL